ncbi:unnamed protein product [Auanema sp. JU1783]|nr:unnamed protein product [Auanema sp. JU1783]
MFLRKKLPTYVEGTQGRYVRRASPPKVPSVSSHNVVKQSPQSSAPKDTSKSTINAHSHHVHSNEMDNGNDPGVSRFQNYSSPNDPPAYSVNNNLGSSNQLYNNQQDYTSGNRSPQPGALSSHSFSDPRREHAHRKPLTTSHSIGNVESYLDNYEPSSSSYATQQQRFVSLQNLPSKNIGNSIIGDECLVSGTPQQDDLPLPHNWTIEVTQKGYRYYVDHNNCRTHWIHPLAKESLPPRWTKIFHEKDGVIYFNEAEMRSQVEHPGIAPPINRTESMLVASHRAESAVANLNIIDSEEVPSWLLLYSQADSELDHLLEWELFHTMQLEEFEYMMLKLYKQEVIETVRKYERMRTMLNKEIVRRTQPHPRE